MSSINRRHFVEMGFAALSGLALAGCGGNATTDSTTETMDAKGDAAEGAAAEETAQDLEILESGYYLDSTEGLKYAIRVRNPNETLCAIAQKVQATCSDASGEVVLSQTVGEAWVFPGEEVFLANFGGFSLENLPDDATIEFSIVPDENPRNAWREMESMPEDPYIVDNLERKDDEYNTWFTCEVTLNVEPVDDDPRLRKVGRLGWSYATPSVILVLRDAEGNIIYGDAFSTTEPLVQGTPVAREFYVNKERDGELLEKVDSWEVFVYHD